MCTPRHRHFASCYPAYCFRRRIKNVLVACVEVTRYADLTAFRPSRPQILKELAGANLEHILPESIMFMFQEGLISEEAAHVLMWMNTKQGDAPKQQLLPKNRIRFYNELAAQHQTAFKRHQESMRTVPVLAVCLYTLLNILEAYHCISCPCNHKSLLRYFDIPLVCLHYTCSVQSPCAPVLCCHIVRAHVESLAQTL